MRANRTMPSCTVIPELGYQDVGAAVEWLGRAFGFVERWRVANHRAQLAVGDGAVAVTDRPGAPSSVLVRVDDADGCFARACAAGARVVHPPADHPYGERQCTVEDPAGHRWTFSQSIADLRPEDWGGTTASAS
jgi:uncharacterized glyoxalase superfamily protein PhnB